jgi:predicted DNA-binding transcriptional regulator AlpA
VAKIRKSGIKATNVASMRVANVGAPPRLIYKPELLRVVGASYSSIFAWMRAGKFPLAREIGPGGRSCKIAWLESEVIAWLANRPPRHMRQPVARVDQAEVSQRRGASR